MGRNERDSSILAKKKKKKKKKKGKRKGKEKKGKEKVLSLENLEGL
jgi:hypothetical protein